MSRVSQIIFMAVIGIVFLGSCNQSNMTKEASPKKEEVKEIAATDYSQPHQYGGWFCPDNLGGFPPMDIQEVKDLTAITDRLPTQEETYDGRSLIFIDAEKYPKAKALDMDLPRVARIHSEHNGMDELIIVIQAVVVQKDTVVGYRFASGGNGSAWLGQVDFLSESELKAMNATPYVHLDNEIMASKSKIWDAITSTSYAKELGETFKKKEFLASEWSSESNTYLNSDSNGAKASGVIGDMWGNLYLHIDYDYNGFQYTEKVLVMENEDGKSANIQLVAGPFPDDYGIQADVWNHWMSEVKRISEE